jgi:hypothetical protein
MLIEIYGEPSVLNLRAADEPAEGWTVFFICSD